MNIKFDNCTFVNMRKQIEVSIPTDIEVKSCIYDGRSNLFGFSNASRSLVIRDCDLTVNDVRFNLILVDGLPRTSFSEIRNCRFTVNDGAAIAVLGLASETSMNLIGCRFDRRVANCIMSLKGNFLFEGNTFMPSASKTTPIIKFIGGKLNIIRVNLNCIQMGFRDTFLVDNNIIDSSGQKILIWEKNNNRCLQDTTFQFTLTQDFTNSRQFTASRHYTQIVHKVNNIYSIIRFDQIKSFS